MTNDTMSIDPRTTNETKRIRIRNLQVGQIIVFDNGPDCECVGCQPIGADHFIVDWTEPDGSTSSTAPTAGGRPVTVRA